MNENEASEALTKEFSKIAPSKDDLSAIYNGKYGNTPDLGWGPKLRSRFKYYTPDDYYEAAVNNLVTPGCSWADIGCGRDIFPSNASLAEKLSKKADYLLGIDPDENINQNAYLNERFKGVLEEYTPNRKYDLVTLRMVAEHIANPESTIQELKKLSKPGGLVVIYTPNKWAPMSILARLTPMSMHHFFKKMLWDTEERDTFPVQFKMNTRKRLNHLFESKGFEEIYFSYLDDCRIFTKLYSLKYLELSLWRFFAALGLRYPENCLMGIYRMR